MKARKKAGVIEVEEFQPDRQPWPLNVRQRMSVGGTPMDAWFVWNPLHTSEINLQSGDYVRIDNPEDTYPIARAYFAENFDVVDDVEQS